MNNIYPKYRRPLNQQQLDILHILYRFRFATTDLIAKYQNKNGGPAVFNRLRILCEQDLIDRNFDSSYRLQGKPATYFLMPRGIAYLKNNPDYN